MYIYNSMEIENCKLQIEKAIILKNILWKISLRKFIKPQLRQQS